MGLAALGPRVVRLLLLPHVAPYCAALASALALPAGQRASPRATEAARVHHALAAATAAAVADLARAWCAALCHGAAHRTAQQEPGHTTPCKSALHVCGASRLTCRCVAAARRRNPGDCFELRARREARCAAAPPDAAGPSYPENTGTLCPAPCVPGRPVLRGAPLAFALSGQGGPLRQGMGQNARTTKRAAHLPARMAVGAATKPGRTAATAGRAEDAAGDDAAVAMEVDAASPAKGAASGGTPAPATAEAGVADVAGGDGEVVGSQEGLAGQGSIRTASAAGDGPEAALADAWREDANAGRVLRGVQEVFGDALLPYAPAPAIAGLFL